MHFTGFMNNTHLTNLKFVKIIESYGKICHIIVKQLSMKTVVLQNIWLTSNAETIIMY